MNDSLELYWRADCGELVFCNDPYTPSPFADYLQFIIREWFTDRYTLDEVADGLQRCQCGDLDADDVDWVVCRHIIYRKEFPYGTWQEVALLQPSCGAFLSDNETNPKDRDTMRLERHGCSHSSLPHVATKRKKTTPP